MKNILFSIGMILSPAVSTTPAMAMTEAQSIIEYCAATGELARGIMSIRQHGASLISQISRVEERAADAHWDRIETEMILQAYRYPKMEYPENRDQLIEGFKNNWELICLEREMNS